MAKRKLVRTKGGRALLATGKSQRELARLLGVTPAAVSSYIAGRFSPGAAGRAKACELFGIPPDDWTIDSPEEGQVKVREVVAAMVAPFEGIRSDLREIVSLLKREVEKRSPPSEGSLEPGQDMQATTLVNVEACGACDGGGEPVIVRAVITKSGARLELAVCSTCAQLSPHLLASHVDDRIEAKRRARAKEREAGAGDEVYPRAIDEDHP